MQCCQCGKPAMFLVGPDESPLCLDCNLKYQQLMQTHLDMLIRQLNSVRDEIDAKIGFHVTAPRIPERQSLNVTGGITLNNIKVDNSTIGVLNTGSIETVDVAIGALKGVNEDDIASAIKDLTQAVIENSTIQADTKDDMLELISVLAVEATAPKEKRRAKAMRPLLTRLNEIVGTVAGLIVIWEKVGPIITQAFQ